MKRKLTKLVIYNLVEIASFFYFKVENLEALYNDVD